MLERLCEADIENVIVPDEVREREILPLRLWLDESDKLDDGVTESEGVCDCEDETDRLALDV